MQVIFLAGVVMFAGAFTAVAVADESGCEPERPYCNVMNAASVNPYLLLDVEQEELVVRFPAMPERERDLLWFKISDIKSMR